MDPLHDAPDAPEIKFNLRELQPWNDPERVTENERLLGGLCYVSQILIPLILPIIVLLTAEAKKSNYVRYHAVHSLALFAAAIVYGLVALFGFLLVVMIWAGFVCVAWLLFVPPLIALVYYGWQAFVGRATVMPWLTEFLTRYNLL
jgi:uncharacterized membrane protein